MPEYKQSKSQKRSKSQSKNGGRRRKHTTRKLRRGKKSRKVMRGGGFTNEQLIEAYNKYFYSNRNDPIFLLTLRFFPKLFELTDVGKNTPIDRRNKIPEFWLSPDALKMALTEDTNLNEKINNDPDLIRFLSPKTPEQDEEERRLLIIRRGY